MLHSHSFCASKIYSFQCLDSIHFAFGCNVEIPIRCFAPAVPWAVGPAMARSAVARSAVPSEGKAKMIEMCCVLKHIDSIYLYIYIYTVYIYIQHMYMCKIYIWNINE